jgi:exonuclease SbcD
MRILHTADWHLADRLGRIDRTAELQEAVEHVAGICERERVDVLLIAGDVFSDLARPESRQEAVGHFSATFQPFLSGGGTALAITGNHDNETFCKTLQEAFRLASPTAAKAGDLLPSGRLHLASGPTFFRLAGRDGSPVQFACLPYPFGHRYLDDPRQRFASLDERHRAIHDACAERLEHMRSHLDPTVPSVLAAHLYVAGTAVRGLFRLSEQEDIAFGEQALASGWAYVALGHIHQPQALPGLPHVRYAGSLQRLDMGERDDEKSVTLIDIGPQGLEGEPRVIPVDSTPLYDVKITHPQAELPTLAERYPDAARALVKLDVTYRPGEDDLPAILNELDRLFPRCYLRTHHPAVTASAPSTAVNLPDTPHGESGPTGTVLAYLEHMLTDDPDREDLLTMARDLADGA